MQKLRIASGNLPPQLATNTTADSELHEPDKYLTAPLPIDTMPPGVPYIIGNEAAERFCFYGMKTILIVFMTKFLLDRQGNLAAMSDEEAKGYYHLFVAGVYFFPILGAILADAVWGKFRTIFYLSLVYCLGNFALAADQTRVGLFVGLLLITLGAGGIKSSVSANVGDQFGPREQASAGKGLRLVLLLDQLRLVLLHAADARAAGSLQPHGSLRRKGEASWPGGRLRRAGRVDGHRHAGLLAGAQEVRPHSARRQHHGERGIQPRRGDGHRQAGRAVPVHRHVLGPLRADGRGLGAPGRKDGSPPVGMASAGRSNGWSPPA